MKLHGHLLEEVLNGETCGLNGVLSQLWVLAHGLEIVEVKGLHSFCGESIATKRVHAKLTLVDIVDDHDRVSEVSVLQKHQHEVGIAKCQSKFAADVDTNLIV